MGWLSNILTTIRKNTLDRTNIDEQIGQGLSNIGKGVTNFFTKKLPQFASNADRYLQNPTFASDASNLYKKITNTNVFTGQPTMENPQSLAIRKMILEPSAKIIDKGVGSAYKIGKENTGINKYLKAIGNTNPNAIQPSSKPTATDYFNALGTAGLANVPANIVGGVVGAGAGSYSNVVNKKPILSDLEKNYNEGYSFSSKLGPYDEILGATASTLKGFVPPKVQAKIISSPIVQKVIKTMTPEEITGFGTWIRNSLRAGVKSGPGFAIYGALQDAKNGQERLQNAWRESSNAMLFSTGQHAGLGLLGIGGKSPVSIESKKLVDLVKKTKDNIITDIKYPEAKQLSDIMGRATDKAHPPVTNRPGFAKLDEPIIPQSPVGGGVGEVNKEVSNLDSLKPEEITNLRKEIVSLMERDSFNNKLLLNLHSSNKYGKEGTNPTTLDPEWQMKDKYKSKEAELKVNQNKDSARMKEIFNKFGISGWNDSQALDFIQKLTDKANSIPNVVEAPKSKPLTDIYAKKKAEIDAKMAENKQVINSTPLNEKFFKPEVKQPRLLPLARTETESRNIQAIADAMEASSKHFNRPKAEKALSAIFKNKTPEEQAKIVANTDFSKGDKSIMKFWRTHIPNKVPLSEFIKTKDAEWKQANDTLIEPDSVKPVKPEQTTPQDITPVQTVSNESIQNAPKTPKKLSQLKGMTQTPEDISQSIDQLNTHPKKASVQGETAVKATKNLIEHQTQIYTDIQKGYKKLGVTDKQFQDYIEKPNTAPPEVQKLVDLHNKAQETIHPLLEDSNVGQIPNHYPHMTDSSISEAKLQQQINSDLWLSKGTMEGGLLKERTGKMTEYSSNYPEVMKNYSEQAAYRKYGDRMGTPEQVKIVETIDKHIDSTMKNGVTDKFDYVEATAQKNKTTTKVGKELDYNVRGINLKINDKQIIDQKVETFDEVRRHIAEKGATDLSDAMRNVRDATDNIPHYVEVAMTKQKPGEYLATEVFGMKGNKAIETAKAIDSYMTNIATSNKSKFLTGLIGNNRKRQVQNLMEIASTYNLKGTVKDYINKQIDFEMKTGKMEQGILGKATNFITSMFYNAQIPFNLRTAIQQKTESTRIPALYGPKITAETIKQRALDKIKGRDILRDYGFSEKIADQYREFGGWKEAPTVFSKMQDFWDKTGNAMVRATENSKNADFLTAAEIKGKQLGYTGEKLYNYVRDELFTGGYIMHKYNTPELLKNSNLMRLLLQYQQYTIKDLNLMVDKGLAGAEGQTGKFNKSIGALKGIAPLATAKATAAVIMMVVTGQTMKTIGSFNTWANDMNLRLGPAFSTALQLGQKIKDYYDSQNVPVGEEDFYGNKKKLDAKKYFLSQLKGIAMRNAVPAGVQIMKSKGAIDVWKKGYAETSTGNITYPAPTNFFNLVQGFFFGTSSFHESQDYYAGGYKSTGGTRGQKIKDVFAAGYKVAGREMINQNLVKQDVYKEFDKNLTQSQKDTIKSLYVPKETDAQGNQLDSANNTSIRMAEANLKWAKPNVMQIITDREKEVATRTGLPLNPIYNLTPDQQSTYFRIKSLPPGDSKKKELETISASWLQPFYKASNDYSESATKQGIFGDNPNFGTGTKPSPELQKKLDVYNMMNKNDRKIYLKENPDIVDYFNQVSLETNLKQLALGLVPNALSESTGYGGYTPKGKSGATKLKELLASNKKLRTQLAGISVSKQSKLLKDIMAKRKKITLDDLKSVKIDTKPSKSFK